MEETVVFIPLILYVCTLACRLIVCRSMLHVAASESLAIFLFRPFNLSVETSHCADGEGMWQVVQWRKFVTEVVVRCPAHAVHVDKCLQQGSIRRDRCKRFFDQ